VTCPYCATELPPGALFCGECGRSVSQGATGTQGATEQLPSAATPALPSEPDPQPELGGEPESEHCAQCGAVVAASDIFCGECGFVRQSGTPAATRARDTVALDPFPWGAAPMLETPTFGDDLDETRIVDRSAGGDRFVLQFSTGESVSVSGTGLVGRNPVAEPGEYFDSLVTIADPGKSVSKTHLEFGQTSGSFWVSDRFSGNGTVVREPGSPPRRCDAGKRYRIVRGTRIDIGEQFFVVS